MKILVLGGTGAMGKPVVKILGARGHQVDVTTRKARNDEGDNIIMLLEMHMIWHFWKTF